MNLIKEWKEIIFHKGKVWKLQIIDTRTNKSWGRDGKREHSKVCSPSNQLPEFQSRTRGKKLKIKDCKDQANCEVLEAPSASMEAANWSRYMFHHFYFLLLEFDVSLWDTYVEGNGRWKSSWNMINNRSSKKSIVK